MRKNYKNVVQGMAVEVRRGAGSAIDFRIVSPVLKQLLEVEEYIDTTRCKLDDLNDPPRRDNPGSGGAAARPERKISNKPPSRGGFASKNKNRSKKPRRKDGEASTKEGQKAQSQPIRSLQLAEQKAVPLARLLGKAGNRGSGGEGDSGGITNQDKVRKELVGSKSSEQSDKTRGRTHIVNGIEEHAGSVGQHQASKGTSGIAPSFDSRFVRSGNHLAVSLSQPLSASSALVAGPVSAGLAGLAALPAWLRRGLGWISIGGQGEAFPLLGG